MNVIANKNLMLNITFNDLCGYLTAYYYPQESIGCLLVLYVYQYWMSASIRCSLLLGIYLYWISTSIGYLPALDIY